MLQPLKLPIIIAIIFVTFCVLKGCDFNSSSQANVDLNAVMNSGTEMLSGAWNTAKSEAGKLAEEAKNQYNSGVDQIKEGLSDRMQGRADQVRNQMD